MRKTFAILVLILFLTLGCVREDIQPVEPDVGEEPGIEEEIECDAVTPCSKGYECVKLPDKTSPTCVTEETLQSPEYKDCAIAESYPVQLICPRINSGDGCESDSDCEIGGCNGEICGSKESIKDVASICLYKPEFECYTLTNCKCTSGRCDWERTEEFLNCIATKKVNP